MDSILVKLPNWLGDILFSFDLLYTLATNFRNVGFLTSGNHAELFSVFPFPNAQIISYEQRRWPWLDIESFQKIDTFRPDCGLLLPNSFGSALLMKYAGVKNLFGYDTESRGFMLLKAIPKPLCKMHQTEYYSNLLTLFDMSPVAYPQSSEHTRDSLIVIHPGASKIERAWNLERYLEIAEILKAEGFEVVFVTGEGMRLSNSFHTLSQPTLHEFCTLLRECRLFIGNDSGPLHLAQQCGAAVLGIYGPGDPLVTGPRPITPGRIIYHNYPCSPCRQKFFKECSPSPSGKPFCIDTIQVQEVLTAIKQIGAGS